MRFSELDEAYRQMAEDEQRKAKALEWSEATLYAVADEPTHRTIN